VRRGLRGREGKTKREGRDEEEVSGIINRKIVWPPSRVWSGLGLRQALIRSEP
jgi:hypothetical protein